MRRLFARVLTIALLALTLPFTASAQEPSRTILVMDGSGSMWGQIDGVNKIVIAREVVASVLEDFPQDQYLGLTAYGHRREGDCTDIETIVAPAPASVPEIVGLVEGITPLGRTPMTDAVIAAAEALRYTEEKATVILVSDGIETCHPDPCEAARILEEAGVDFTAHVVGFDVADEVEALAQMQCIAEETGGVFITADNAEQLTEALQTVTEAAVVAEPDPIMAAITLEARIGSADGPLVETPVMWTVGEAVTGEQGNPYSVTLGEGDYAVSGLHLVAELSETATLTIADDAAQTITLVFPEPPPPPAEITFEARMGEGGPLVESNVTWTLNGPEGTLTETAPGFAAMLPEGIYSVTVTHPEGGEPASRDIIVGDSSQLVSLILQPVIPQASLTAFASAPLGSTIPVGWDGPDERNDFIAVSRPGDDRWENYSYTREGDPVELLMPAEAGTFELRYIRNEGQEILARRTIELTPVEVSLDAAETAVAGATIPVAWIGPDYQNDFIAVSDPEDDRWIHYTHTRRGTPAEIELPIVPGEYVLRYFISQDNTIMAERPITVTPVTATISGPDTAAVGSDIPVAWDGPNYQNDYIGIGLPEDDNHVNYEYTRNGNPVELSLPTEPGTYELRYYAAQDRTILARQQITLTEVGATLSAQAEAVVGDTIPVTWEGPDYQNDYIGIGLPGEAGHVRYEYTRHGSPAQLQLPTEPGDYEIRYYVGQDRTILASIPITLVSSEGTVSAPAEAVAGSEVEVTWTGPDYPNDYIGVGLPGNERYQRYTYTREGSPLMLQMPTEPGTYEIRYYLNQGGVILASTQITLTPIKAEIQGPATAVIGETIAIAWDGPDYPSDYVAVAEPEDDRYEHYTYTNRGNPAQLQMPSQPGTYELRYYVNQDSRIVARQTIEVSDLSMTMLAEDSAAAGGTIVIGHDGPEYQGDYIGIFTPGGDRHVTYSYTDRGNPLEVNVPDEPGAYEIRYVMRLDGRVLATRPLTVTE